MQPAPTPHALTTPDPLDDVVDLLNIHHDAYQKVKPYADSTGHPVPTDTAAWSQIIVSRLTGVGGLKREKGADLDDGSDVKGANTWGAIDKPRFNGIVSAGRVSKKSKLPNDVSSLDGRPHTYLVLWDENAKKRARFRIWAVRSAEDPLFRGVCGKWYAEQAAKKTRKEAAGETYRPGNFQLHPDIGGDSDVIRNTCGALEYPLLLSAVMGGGGFEVTDYEPNVLTIGLCKAASN